jgi:ubiquinone/menaquinone biosynthesis C-methylase UbiE
LPLKNISTRQEVATSIHDLQDSYNRLYQEWLGEHRNNDQPLQLVKLLDVKAGRLLDVACGLGFLLDFAKERGASAFGLDISRVALAKGKADDPTRRMIEGNGEHLPWPDESFDYVTCLGSLEHFISPDEGAREIARVLKSTGKAAIMLPNSHHLQAIHNVYKTGSILPELQDFERFATRVEWQALLEENGLQVESVHKFNTGFSRYFKKGREGFWYIYNILFRLLGDIWIPTNLSFALTFICTKTPPPAADTNG